MGGSDARKLYGSVEQAKLLERSLDLRAAQHFVRLLMKMELQAGLQFDPATGRPSGYIGKITLKEPDYDPRAKGLNSIDDLFSHADNALTAAG